MIGDAEIRRRALDLGVAPRQVERDHVLCHLLAAIAEDPGPLVFRGGSALARVYWPDHRLSEDLDFISGDRFDLEDVLGRAVEVAGGRSRIGLDLAFTGPRRGLSRSVVKGGDQEVVIDVNLGERTYLPVEHRALQLPYSDLRDPERTIPLVSLAEILGNKWFMLEDRSEPRDLYDIWWGLTRAEVPFDELSRGLRAKYAFWPKKGQLKAARRAAASWEERLGNQIMDLPTFEEVFDTVTAALEQWEEAAR